MLWLQHVFFIGCDTLIALRKTSQKIVILSCIVIILTFNFSTSYVKADSWAAEFADESIAAYFGSVVTTVTAIGAGVNNAQDFVAEYGHDIYNTAKETWPKMSADMQAKFKDSMSQMADGIIVAGDWITAVLDALKSDFGGTNVPDVVKTGDNTFVLPAGLNIYTTHPSTNSGVATGSISVYYSIFDSGCGKNTIQIWVTSNGSKLAQEYYYSPGNCGGTEAIYAQGLSAYEMAKSAKTLMDLKRVLEAIGATVTLTLNDAPLVPTNNSYNRIDEWLRDVAIPAGTLGVYSPSEAWTTNGYRLGLSQDGQQLLTLPDGLPYDPAIHGEYSWRQPLTRVIDGVPAVLNPTTWDWVNARDKTIVRPAEIPEIAEYVGTDVDTAEKIKNQTKGEEGTTGGKLKNPTKKLVWTPLMMSGEAMTKKFPFSIPWDFANQLAIFDVQPKAPVIEINKPNFFTIDGQNQSMIWTIDFTYLDPIATAVRWFAIIAFDVGLILMIRRIMPE